MTKRKCGGCGKEYSLLARWYFRHGKWYCYRCIKKKKNGGEVK